MFVDIIQPILLITGCTLLELIAGIGLIIYIFRG